jgi:biotin synthase-related radical SAM superfamily protein
VTVLNSSCVANAEYTATVKDSFTVVIELMIIRSKWQIWNIARVFRKATERFTIARNVLT